MKKTIYTLIAILGFANFTMAQVPNYVPTNGLVAWYSFSGNANDQSGNANNGTVIGATLTTDRNGNGNSAYNFSNVNDRIPIPSINCNNILSYSVSGWFKKTNQNQEGTIFGQANGCNGSNGLRLFVGQNNKMFWQTELTTPDCHGRGTQDHVNDYSDNTWHFFVVTYNGGTGTMYSSQYKIYIDNIWVSSSNLDSTGGSQIVTAPVANTTNSTTIGNLNIGTDALIGKLDDIGIWNRVLTQTEVTALFTSSVLTTAQVPNYVPTNGLVGWYPFSGNANDQSGNANNGTVIGATLTTDRNGNGNSAYNFSNVNDRIPIPSINCNNILSYSVSGWFKKTNQNQSGTIFGQSNGCQGSNGLRLFVGQNNKMFWQTELTTPDCHGRGIQDHINDYSDNTWHFFVVTYNGSTGTMYSSQYKIYIDNIWVSNSNLDSTGGSQIVTAPVANTTNSTTIGNLNIGTDALIGKLDDIGIWNRVLTQTEITALFTSSSCDTISNQPTNQTVNINSNASFIVATNDSLATYQWQTDLGMGFQNISSAGQFNGATNDTLIVSNTSMTNNNQNFRCIVSSGTCKDTSSIAKLTVNNNTGINSPSNVNALKVYPNPASTILHIDLEKPGYYTAKLSSVAGQSIVSLTTGTIDISALANGVYILTIYDSNNKLISTNKVAIVK